MTVLTNIRRQI